MQEKIIFLFPGQGAQYPGMCQDIYREYACVRHVFELVSDYSCENIKNMCFNLSSTDLMRPDRASLTTLTASMSIVAVIKDYFKSDLDAVTDYVAGHSMGQYSALCAVDSVCLSDTVRVLKERSLHTMSVTGHENGMICIVGLDKQQIDKLVDSVQTKGFAAVANYNSYNQFVISGENKVLNLLLDKARFEGAKLAKRLDVSIPAHCKLMKPVQKLMRDSLKKIVIKSPKIPLFSNETANLISNPERIKDALVNQICNGVNWVGIMNKFPEYNIVRAYELGPGKVLSGLVNRANIGCVAQNMGTLANVRLGCRQLENVIAAR